MFSEEEIYVTKIRTHTQGSFRDRRDSKENDQILLFICQVGRHVPKREFLSTAWDGEEQVFSFICWECKKEAPILDTAGISAECLKMVPPFDHLQQNVSSGNHQNHTHIYVFTLRHYFRKVKNLKTCPVW